jgi:chloride channel 7
MANSFAPLDADDEQDTSFFQIGRDFEPAFVNHKYTKAEQVKLAEQQSIDYLPANSRVYKLYREHSPESTNESERWLMMGMIGACVGFTGFMLHNLIDRIADYKYDQVKQLAAHNDHGAAWLWLSGYSLVFVIFSAGINAYWHPPAAGSGIPEVIAYLNGAMVRKVFNFKTVVAKFLSCAAAVGSGLPVGPEGPMIHLGAMLGAGISQMRSDTLGFDLKFFARFRNSKDKRDFISAGAAAGVSSAFGAPVGGLLFAMEEVSSFWNQKLGWQIFFCCMVSTTVTSLFNSSFEGFKYVGEFGYFREKSAILFEVIAGIPNNVLIFIPAALLGVLGGIFGTIFTFCNLKIAKWRARVVTPTKWARVLEPCVILLILITLTVFVPTTMSCTKSSCDTSPHYNSSGYSFATGQEPKQTCLWAKRHPLSNTEPEVSTYGCPLTTDDAHGTSNPDEKVYSESATLLWSTGDEVIKHMFSRGTYLEFELPALLVFLVIYFPLACWSAGATISSGLVVPMLLIGSVYGRIIGVLMVKIFGSDPAGQGEWVDPGVFALIGAASFFGGVSRLTMSLTVIMVEITNEVRLLLPIMTSIMVAKWVADNATHSLYHAQIEQKCIPFLDFNLNTQMSMELFTAHDVAKSPVIILEEIHNVHELAKILISCPHNAFPVVHHAQNPKERSDLLSRPLHGLVQASVLRQLLSREELYRTSDAMNDHHSRGEIPLLRFEECVPPRFRPRAAAPPLPRANPRAPRLCAPFPRACAAFPTSRPAS